MSRRDWRRARWDKMFRERGSERIGSAFSGERRTRVRGSDEIARQVRELAAEFAELTSDQRFGFEAQFFRRLDEILARSDFDVRDEWATRFQPLIDRDGRPRW